MKTVLVNIFARTLDMTANQIGPEDNDPGRTTNDDEKSCRSKIKEFFRDKGIVILGLFIGLGTVQDSSSSSFQCLIKKL